MIKKINSHVEYFQAPHMSRCFFTDTDELVSEKEANDFSLAQAIEAGEGGEAAKVEWRKRYALWKGRTLRFGIHAHGLAWGGSLNPFGVIIAPNGRVMNEDFFQSLGYAENWEEV